MAVIHAGQNADVDSLKQGMTMIFNEFEKALENAGVTRFSALGQLFDPNLHEAVSQEPSAEVPADSVSREWKCGYRIGDRLLRPATVVVSAGPG
jgi:molecular chaperone GrpE